MYTLTQERTPESLRARVIGARIAFANLAVPLGMVSVGVLLEFLGLRATLLLLAAAQAALAAAVVALPALRTIDLPVSLPGSIAQPAARPHRQTHGISPDWRWVGTGLLCLAVGSPIVPWLLGRDGLAGGWPGWAHASGLLVGAALFALGWVTVAAGLRVMGSRRRGALCGASLYVAAGAITAVLATGSEKAQLVTPMTQFPLILAILVTGLTWPVVLACLLGLGPRRSV